MMTQPSLFDFTAGAPAMPQNATRDTNDMATELLQNGWKLVPTASGPWCWTDPDGLARYTLEHAHAIMRSEKRGHHAN